MQDKRGAFSLSRHTQKFKCVFQALVSGRRPGAHQKKNARRPRRTQHTRVHDTPPRPGPRGLRQRLGLLPRERRADNIRNPLAPLVTHSMFT